MNCLFDLLKQIPRGRVTTYKELARALHSSPRAVGQALKHNKQLITIPCHRVVMSDGRLGGYVRGVKAKARLLLSEGVLVRNCRVDLRECFYTLSC